MKNVNSEINMYMQPNNYILLTKPVRDSEGNIIEHAKYLDATPLEADVARVWNLLSDEQKQLFYYAMSQKVKEQPEMDGAMHR